MARRRKPTSTPNMVNNLVCEKNIRLFFVFTLTDCATNQYDLHGHTDRLALVLQN